MLDLKVSAGLMNQPYLVVVPERVETHHHQTKVHSPPQWTEIGPSWRYDSAEVSVVLESCEST